MGASPLRVVGSVRPAWMDTLKAGDALVPDKLWNRTEGDKRRRLAPLVRAVEVRFERGCQWGCMVRVPTMHGADLWLSAGWFRPA
jgi:hypothetical protein